MEEICRHLFLWEEESKKQRQRVTDLRQKNEALVYNILPAHVARDFTGRRRPENVSVAGGQKTQGNLRGFCFVFGFFVFCLFFGQSNNQQQSLTASLEWEFLVKAITSNRADCQFRVGILGQSNNQFREHH